MNTTQIDKVKKFELECSISYAELIHPSGDSCEEIAEYYRSSEFSNLNYGHCKNLLLTDGKEFYLVIVDKDKKVDMSHLTRMLHVDELESESLEFATSEEDVLRILGVRPGSLSILNLVNVEKGRVELVIDEELFMKYEYLAFHPNDNNVTHFIPVKDVKRMVYILAYAHNHIINVPGKLSVNENAENKLNIDENVREVKSFLRSINLGEEDYVETPKGKESPGETCKYFMLETEKGFCMIMTLKSKRVDFDNLKRILEVESCTILTRDKIREKLKLNSEILSPFSLINNKDIRLCVDRDLFNNICNVQQEFFLDFNPNTNIETISIPLRYLMNLLNGLGKERCSILEMLNKALTSEERETINAAKEAKAKKKAQKN